MRCGAVTKMNESETEKARARRAIRLLYLAMFAFIAGPVLVYLLLRHTAP